jgi:hypothetical protein
MAELAWPTQRPNPLKSFNLYDGRFNAFDINYIAVRALAMPAARRWLPRSSLAAHAPSCASRRAAARRRSPVAPLADAACRQSVAWCGFFGVCLGASVVLFSFLYLLGKAGLWLCTRHQVVVRCVMHMRPGPAAIRLGCCAVASADLYAPSRACRPCVPCRRAPRSLQVGPPAHACASPPARVASVGLTREPMWAHPRCSAQAQGADCS